MSCSFAKNTCFSHTVLCTFPSATADKSWFSFAHPEPTELAVCWEPAPFPSALSSDPDSSSAASTARRRQNPLTSRGEQGQVRHTPRESTRSPPKGSQPGFTSGCYREVACRQLDSRGPLHALLACPTEGKK